MSPDSHWSGTQTVPTAPGDCRRPAITAVGDVLHVVWTQGRTLNHTRLSGGTWSEPSQVAVGGQAVLASTPDGIVHCLFSAQMLGNVEIYHTAWDGATWGLPEVVSRTRGVSIYPALAVSPDGSLHAAWADTTPGYSTIYYGRRVGGPWTSTPIPNGSGSHPTIAAAQSGEIYVAWQSRLPDSGRFEIFCAIDSPGGWSLPEDVSDNDQHHSLHPTLVIGARGVAHLVWQEDRGEIFGIRYADRRPNGWSLPVDVSQTDADCRLPRICANRQGYSQAAWSQGQILAHRVRPVEGAAAWWPIETACDLSAEVSDLAAALTAKGELHVVWAAYAEGETRRLFHIRREPVFKSAVFMPLIAQDAEAETTEGNPGRSSSAEPAA